MVKLGFLKIKKEKKMNVETLLETYEKGEKVVVFFENTQHLVNEISFFEYDYGKIAVIDVILPNGGIKGVFFLMDFIPSSKEFVPACFGNYLTENGQLFLLDLIPIKLTGWTVLPKNIPDIL